MPQKQTKNRFYPSSSKTEKSVGFVLAFATLTSLAAFSLPISSALAADFSKAKKTYVPPSRISRRFDEQSMDSSGGSSGTADYSNSPGYEQAFGSPASSATNAQVPPPPAKTGKYGLIPPPPPITPSMLPNSLMHSQVPPPPGSGAKSASSGASASASSSRWSSSQTSSGFTKAASSSQLKTTGDQTQDRAIRLAQEGKYQDAQQTLLRAMKQNPKDKSLHQLMAKVTVDKAQSLMASSNYDAAAESARNALTVDPSNPKASSLLSSILTKQGLNASSVDTRLNLAQQLAAQNRTTEAAVEYHQANNIKPNAAAYIGLGDLASKSNARDRAKANYQKALEVQPDSSAALRQMGLLQLEQNDVVGANTNLSRALVLNPGDKTASSSLIGLWQGQVNRNQSSANGHLGLARALQLSGNLSQAQNEYKQVVKIDPNNPNLPAARQSFKLALARQESTRSYDAAQTLASQGAFTPAYQKASEAAALAPGDARINLYKGQLAQKLGMNSDAKDAYMTVLKSDPGNVTAAQQLSVMSGGAVSGMAAAGAGLGAGLGSGMAANEAAAVLPNSMASQPSGLTGAAQNASSALTSMVGTMGGGMPPVASPMSSITSGLGSPGYGNGLGPNTSALSNAASPLQTGATTAAINPSGELPPSPTIPALRGASPTAMAAGAASNVASAAQQIPQPDQAGNLAGFLTNMRNSAVKNQLAMQEWESQVHKELTGRSSYYQGNGQLGDVPVTPEAIIGQSPGKGSDRYVSRALADLGFGQNVPAANTAALAPTELQSGIPVASGASSAAAVAGASGVPAAALRSAIPTGGSSGSYPSTESSAYSAPAGMSAGQSSGLPSGLPAGMPGGSSYTPIPTGSGIPASALPSDLGPAPSSLTGMANAAPAMASALPLTAGGASPIAGLSASQFRALQAMRPAANPSAPVKMELESFRPSPTGMNLKVALRNNQSVPLNLPERSTAVIRESGMADKEVKVMFPGRSVPAGGVVHGSIHIPGHSLNPAADLLIPNVLPATASGGPDVHLTIPISSL